MPDSREGGAGVGVAGLLSAVKMVVMGRRRPRYSSSFSLFSSLHNHEVTECCSGEEIQRRSKSVDECRMPDGHPRSYSWAHISTDRFRADSLINDDVWEMSCSNVK